jgi:quinol monooxygenase YgiN
MSVLFLVHVHAADGNADALLALLRQGRDLSLAAQGCESFEVWQAQDQPGRFVMVERWRSIEDHHANFARNIKGSGHLDRILPLLAEPIRGGAHLLR